MSSIFKMVHVGEPLLEFGGEGRHLDVRFGLIDHGPVDFSLNRTKTVKVGLVGNSKTADGLRDWFRRCDSEVPAKQSRQPNLFPAFPGIGIGGPFRCWFEIDDKHQRILTTSAIAEIVKEPVDEIAIRKAVDLFKEEIRDLSQMDRPPQVIICALPIEIIERVKNLQVTNDPETEDNEDVDASVSSDSDDRSYKDFRGALKAASMPSKIPIQIVWPSTYDNTALIKRKLARLSDRRVQDEATRAWNFFCALYYKSGGTPWRMIRDRAQYDTTYVGISFFQDRTRDSLRTSSAQLFDERGEGIILKGGTALEDKRDRHPYLSRDDAYSLLKRSLQAYKREHGNFPARLVIHKSAKFHDDELEGLNGALEDVGIEMADFIWLPQRSPVKLVRQGDYPPLRGTAMKLDQDSAILYTRGSVDFFATYPGMYVPNPLILRCQRRDRTEWGTLLQETMALTKMNWNNTQFDGALPITMRAAKQVGEILKYIPDGGDFEADPRYRFYM